MFLILELSKLSILRHNMFNKLIKYENIDKLWQHWYANYTNVRIL